MTGPNDPNATSGDEELSPEELAELEKAPALGALLKRSLGTADDPVAGPDPLLLESVQKKLRKRSKGKFYGDGWSTTHSRINYALVAAVMLVTIVAVYLALGPTGLSAR